MLPSPDGRLLYRLRHRWRDGTTQIVFEPHQLLARLVLLIPAPRSQQVRYHGVLAPCAGWRDRVVPAGPQSGKAAPPARCRPTPDEETGTEEGSSAGSPDRRKSRPSAAAESSRPLRRYAWADLLRRVFAVDVLECPDCGGRMRILPPFIRPMPPAPFWSVSACRRAHRPPPPHEPSSSPRSPRLPTGSPPHRADCSPPPDPPMPGKGRHASIRRLAPSRHAPPRPPAQLECPATLASPPVPRFRRPPARQG